MKHYGDDSIIDIAVVIERQTEKAVAILNQKEKLVWLPKSLIEIEHGKDRTATITLPQWLAEREELI